ASPSFATDASCPSILATKHPIVNFLVANRELVTTRTRIRCTFATNPFPGLIGRVRGHWRREIRAGHDPGYRLNSSATDQKTKREPNTALGPQQRGRPFVKNAVPASPSSRNTRTPHTWKCSIVLSNVVGGEQVLFAGYDAATVATANYLPRPNRAGSAWR